MAKATKNTTEAQIEIVPITVGRITVHLLGKTPLIMHRFSQKARQELLFPKGRANAAEKAESLKHDPLMEYREGIYRNSSPSEPTAVHLPSGMFLKALASAALDLPGASRSQILRLVSVSSWQVNLFGIPQLLMNMIRNSDMARTPDLRSRPIFPEWACTVEIEYVSSLLKENQIVNLLAAAGVIVGVGDYRKQKGGAFGDFKVVDADDPNFLRIIKQGGRAAQLAAIESPVAFNAETEELFAWFNQEATRREKVVPSMAVIASAKSKRNGSATLEQ